MTGFAPPAPPDRVTLRSCIGCGARNLDAECTGECSDRRIELVAAGEHERQLERITSLRAVVTQVASSQPPSEGVEPAYRALQAAARSALRGGGTRPAEAEPAERIAAWWCTTCGRIEAPRECLGVCVRHPEPLVNAARFDAARRDERMLSAFAALVASVSPREGQWERNWQAMRSRAEGVLAAIVA